MSDKVEFAKVLAFLAALYPRFKLEDTTMEAYFSVLGDLPIDLLKTAALQIGSEPGPWFPSAGDIRAKAFILLEHQAGIPSAAEAWGEVTRKIGTDGYTRIPEFSHPLITQTVAAVGGWQMICWSEDPVADRARFLQAYDVLHSRHRTGAAMLPQVREALTGGDLVSLADLARRALPAGHEEVK